MSVAFVDTSILADVAHPRYMDTYSFGLQYHFAGALQFAIAWLLWLVYLSEGKGISSKMQFEPQGNLGVSILKEENDLGIASVHVNIVCLDEFNWWNHRIVASRKFIEVCFQSEKKEQIISHSTPPMFQPQESLVFDRPETEFLILSLLRGLCLSQNSFWSTFSALRSPFSAIYCLIPISKSF